MLGWLKRKVQIASINAMGADIDRFLLGLRGASAEEIGGILACTYHWMGFLERKFGWNLDHPDLVMMQDIGASMMVGKCARHIQAKEPALATGLLVWLHTLRASSTPELRLRGRELWSQLTRGAAHIHRGADMAKAILGVDMDLSCRGRVPTNLTTLETEPVPRRGHQQVTAPSEGSDDDLRRSVDLLATQLRAQLTLVARFTNEFPSDDFSAGYVFGTVDAYLQANGVSESSVKAISLISLVYLELHGHPRAGELFGRALNLQTREGPLKTGIQTGGSDMWEYLRTLTHEHTKIPMGLALHHIGKRAA